MKERIRQWAMDCGAAKCGFAKAEPVSVEAQAIYDNWIARGCHGEMAYCAKYEAERNDPRLLLDGANTVICCAFCYDTGARNPYVASYALGNDYHYALKNRLNRLAQMLTETYGGECRALVDTAPMRERYWAQKAGIGFIGINNQLIVKNIGARIFLGELLWTGTVEPDEPCGDGCGECMACVKACPGGALDGKGGCDARKCASYLTIEHRGPLPPDAHLSHSLYGCDICLDACPHNKQAPTTAISEFEPLPEIQALAPETLTQITPSHYRRITRTSAMRRAPLAQLLRNESHVS